MADKTTYGTVDKNDILVFDEDKISTLTFQEFRQLLAGNTPSNPSNMQAISSALSDLYSQLAEVNGNTQAVISDALADFQNILSELINEDEDSLNIGSPSNTLPIEFNDGSGSTIRLKNGVLTTNGVVVENIRIGDYLIKDNPNNNHLQFTYKPIQGGVS